MVIGYDGKRAFQNKTGLGNYSRSLVSILAKHFPQEQYILFAPKQTSLFDIAPGTNITACSPKSKFYQRFPSLWRRSGMVKDISTAGLNIYHGLSNELPIGIERTAVKTIVTVHDLIFERYPETYNFDERYVHRWKIKRACKTADLVIAISRQTKEDIINFYQIDEKKIVTCYQSCNPIFEQVASDEQKAVVKKRYELPDQYFLFVSAISARKNLQLICKAMITLKDKLSIPLVVIGDGKKEKEAAKKLMSENGMRDRLILLNELPQSKQAAFTTAHDFPAIYQQALALIYPSIFEGFGLPILEALWSRLPVISSNTSSLPEVGGDAALYFDPDDHHQLATHMMSVVTDTALVEQLRAKGMEQAQQFNTAIYAENIMKVYKSLS